MENMTNFEKWDKEFRSQNLFAFNNNANGLLWLKVRAVCRGRQIDRFLEENNLTLTSKRIAEQNIELFELLENTDNASTMLDKYLRDRNNEWYSAMNIDIDQLKEDLYKIQQYAWGGDQNNSLDKHLVSRYVKVISKYDELVCRHGEIEANAWNYVQTSWYNNWTSFLIESLFKRHPNVISAVGEIKSVDFFIGNIPVDLKVTYFPKNYMDEKIKAKLCGKKELTWLKSKAKEHRIGFDNNLNDSQLKYVLLEKFAERGMNYVIKELRDAEKAVVFDAKNNPMELMTWLYANQGEMRFGAENRLFVVLVDSTDMEQSWKMKRAIDLIDNQVTPYLNSFKDNTLKVVNFSFKGNPYKSLADIIFVIKEENGFSNNSVK